MARSLQATEPARYASHLETIMERKPPSRPPAPAYPDLLAFVRRYRRRAGVGLVVGVVSASGCDWLKGGVLLPTGEDDTAVEIDGLIAETAETWFLVLPLHGARDLYFSHPWGWIQYQVEATVDDPGLYNWLFDHADEALAAIDAALCAQGIARFETDDGFEDVESIVAQALTHAYRVSTGDTQAGFVDVELAVLAYQDDGDISGDVAVPR
jgi:hypothetical protein